MYCSLLSPSDNLYSTFELWNDFGLNVEKVCKGGVLDENMRK